MKEPTQAEMDAAYYAAKDDFARPQKPRKPKDYKDGMSQESSDCESYADLEQFAPKKLRRNDEDRAKWLHVWDGWGGDACFKLDPGDDAAEEARSWMCGGDFGLHFEVELPVHYYVDDAEAQFDLYSEFETVVATIPACMTCEEYYSLHRFFPSDDEVKRFRAAKPVETITEIQTIDNGDEGWSVRIITDRDTLIYYCLQGDKAEVVEQAIQLLRDETPGREIDATKAVEKEFEFH